MNLVQQILESIQNRVYIWQYAEYEYPVVEDYMFDTPGKDISKVTDRHVWVIGQHIFFTVHRYRDNDEHIQVRDVGSVWEEFRGLQELSDLVSCKPTNSITWDDVHEIHVKSKNVN